MLQTTMVTVMGNSSALITSAYNITLTPAGKNSIPILEIRISQIPSMELAGITLPQRSAVKISIPKRAGGKGTPRALMPTERHAINIATKLTICQQNDGDFSLN